MGQGHAFFILVAGFVVGFGERGGVRPTVETIFAKNRGADAAPLANVLTVAACLEWRSGHCGGGVGDAGGAGGDHGQFAGGYEHV